MKIELDVHTHTLASGHAFSSLQEMAQAAAGKGLKVLGITDHAPGIPGACDPIYFRNFHVIPRQMYGIGLLMGAEINILDTEGHLDMDEFYLQRLDLRIAGIHTLCYRPGTEEENTHGMVQAIANPYVHIISHPGDGAASLRFEPIVLAAKEHHTLLEINNSSLKPSRGKTAARGNNLTHRSRPVRTDDFYDFDLIVGMDDRNIDELKMRAPSVETEKKIHRMTEFCMEQTADHVPDPYYGGHDGFERVLDLLEDACEGLLRRLAPDGE